MTTFLIKVKRDTAADWTSADRVLAEGEIGYETDSRRVKIGDGITAWSGLKYMVADPGSPITRVQETDQHVNNSATLVAASGLVFPIGANESWVYSGMLWFSAAGGLQTTTGLKLAANIPTGATARMSIHVVGYPGPASAAYADRTDESEAGFDIDKADMPGEDVLVHVHVFVENDSTPGDVEIQFAQSNAHASNTTLLAGSAMDGRTVT